MRRAHEHPESPVLEFDHARLLQDQLSLRDGDNRHIGPLPCTGAVIGIVQHRNPLTRELRNLCASLTEAGMQGKLDFKESLIQRVALLKNLEKNVLSSIAQNLTLTEGAERVIRKLKQLGYKVGIISGGFEYFGKYLQNMLGLDYVFANRLEIENGRITGKLKGDIIDGHKKAEILRTIAQVENISLQQTIAVGDGANDLPMISIAGLGVAFHAKPVVKKNAQRSISSIGLDGLLYLMGISEREIRQ